MSIYMSKKSGQKSQEGKKYSELCDGDKGLVLKELLKGDLSHQYFFSNMENVWIYFSGN